MQRQTDKSMVASREEGGGGEERERTRAAGNARRLEGGTCGRETLARWKYKKSKKKAATAKKIEASAFVSACQRFVSGSPN